MDYEIVNTFKCSSCKEKIISHQAVYYNLPLEYSLVGKFTIFNRSMCTDCLIYLINLSSAQDNERILHGIADHIDRSKVEKPKTPLQKARDQFNKNSKLKKSVLEKYEYKCVKCQTCKDITVDHIIPLSKGGTNSIDNLQAMCRPCNSSKGARLC